MSRRSTTWPRRPSHDGAATSPSSSSASFERRGAHYRSRYEQSRAIQISRRSMRNFRDLYRRPLHPLGRYIEEGKGAEIRRQNSEVFPSVFFAFYCDVSFFRLGGCCARSGHRCESLAPYLPQIRQYRAIALRGFPRSSFGVSASMHCSLCCVPGGSGCRP